MLNMTVAEHLRLGIVIPREKLENMIDQAAFEEKAMDASSYLEEASGCFPKEDFLESEIQELRAFGKSMRGERKDDFENLIHRIVERRDLQNQEAEHGKDLVRQALDELE